MLLFRGLLFLVAMSVWIYCVFDDIRTDSPAVHHLPKLVWLVFVVFIPTIGALAWLFLGRPVPLGSRLFQEAARPPMRPPDDSPEFLADLGDEIRRRRRADQLRSGENPQDIEEEIKRLEEELRRRSEEEHDD